MKDRQDDRRLSIRRRMEREKKPGVFRSWNELAPWLALAGLLVWVAIRELF